LIFYFHIDCFPFFYHGQSLILRRRSYVSVKFLSRIHLKSTRSYNTSNLYVYKNDVHLFTKHQFCCKKRFIFFCVKMFSRQIHWHVIFTEFTRKVCRDSDYPFGIFKLFSHISNKSAFFIYNVIHFLLKKCLLTENKILINTCQVNY
jgi:hypothetical protein